MVFFLGTNFFLTFAPSISSPPHSSSFSINLAPSPFVYSAGPIPNYPSKHEGWLNFPSYSSVQPTFHFYFFRLFFYHLAVYFEASQKVVGEMVCAVWGNVVERGNEGKNREEEEEEGRDGIMWKWKRE
jgi:hypothetical protein